MNYNEHNPPHFHAEYQSFEITMDIQTGSITGNMPRRALNLVWMWLDEHRAELLENWENARQRRPLKKIDPLP